VHAASEPWRNLRSGLKGLSEIRAAKAVPKDETNGVYTGKMKKGMGIKDCAELFRFAAYTGLDGRRRLTAKHLGPARAFAETRIRRGGCKRYRLGRWHSRNKHASRCGHLVPVPTTQLAGT
jgi:hypothetical protein